MSAFKRLKKEKSDYNGKSMEAIKLFFLKNMRSDKLVYNTENHTFVFSKTNIGKMFVCIRLNITDNTFPSC